MFFLNLTNCNFNKEADGKFRLYFPNLTFSHFSNFYKILLLPQNYLTKNIRIHNFQKVYESRLESDKTFNDSSF